MSSIHAVRSILFVPGSRPEFLPKAAAAGPDALVLDLEDSVAPQAKEAARSHVASALRQNPERLTFLRINHPGLGALESDLAVLAPHAMQAVIVPKTEEVDDVTRVDRLLADFERAHRLPPEAISIMVVVESSLGLRNLFDLIRAAPRVRGAALASAEEGDFIVDIGGRWTPDGTALAYARGKFVKWWLERSKLPPPASVDEAVRLAEDGALAQAKKITVRRISGEHFERVIRCELGPIPEYCPEPGWNDCRGEEHQPVAVSAMADDDIPF